MQFCPAEAVHPTSVHFQYTDIVAGDKSVFCLPKVVQTCFYVLFLFTIATNTSSHLRWSSLELISLKITFPTLIIKLVQYWSSYKSIFEFYHQCEHGQPARIKIFHRFYLTSHISWVFSCWNEKLILDQHRNGCGPKPQDCGFGGKVLPF